MSENNTLLFCLYLLPKQIKSIYLDFNIKFAVEKEIDIKEAILQN